MLKLVAVASIALATTAAALAITDPGQKGWQYVVSDNQPSVIVYEGTYPHALAWAHADHEATTIYQLPKGKPRCNPKKRTCLVRW